MSRGIGGTLLLLDLQTQRSLGLLVLELLDLVEIPLLNLALGIREVALCPSIHQGFGEGAEGGRQLLVLVVSLNAAATTHLQGRDAIRGAKHCRLGRTSNVALSSLDESPNRSGDRIELTERKNLVCHRISLLIS